MSQHKLRVLTYNVHKGFNVANRHFVLQQIREGLRKTESDILFLQEMQGQHLQHEQKIAGWPSTPHFEYLAETVWPHYVYGKNAVYKAGHHGNAILSKHPFEHSENINVSPYAWASRSMLHAVVQLPSGLPVHIVCVHFGFLGKERRVQVAKLCARLESHVPDDAPLLIAGDFNDWLAQDRHLLHDHLNLQEVFFKTHGHYAKTFPAWLPILAVDRIYFRGLRAQSCERLSQAPWHKLSDHAPLIATFSL